MSGWPATLVVPSALWIVGHVLAARRVPAPPLWAFPLAGFFAPPALLRWCSRPFAEQALAWVVSLIAWAGVFIVGDVPMFLAFGLITAVWCTAAGIGLVSRDGASRAGVTAVEAPPAAPARPVPAPVPVGAEPDEPGATGGFALELRCPACGAAVAVPVYHGMARCEFCGTEHVVSGHGDAITVVIPDAAASEEGLKAAVVKHLRHLHYLKLYDQRVRPLVEDSESGSRGPLAGLDSLASPPTSPLVNTMDAEVDRAASKYAEGIAPRLALVSHRRFLAPYWHRFGTLYQAAFGRDAEGQKRMEFAVVTVEGSVRATSVPLPEMGKLSYLRALRPLLGAPEAEVPALAAESGPEEIDRRAQNLARRTSDLAVTPIAVHATLVPEVVALVYRPWHAAELELDGDRFAVLVDGGSGAVEGEPPVLDPAPSPIRDQGGTPPALTPAKCPECGGELAFAPDAVVHLCRTCFRSVTLRGARWAVLPYLREEPAQHHWTVPFWRFPLRMRMGSGELIVDLPHLTDGVDGAFDQIGEHPQVAQEFLVPAFRTRVSRAGLRLYRRLWPLIQGTPRGLLQERFSPAAPPERVVDVTLPAPEARVFASVYLALAFTPRDLARAQVKSVREQFLSAKLEGEPELVFLNLPEDAVAPFQALFGRPRLAALEGLRGERPRSSP